MSLHHANIGAGLQQVRRSCGGVRREVRAMPGRAGRFEDEPYCCPESASVC